MTGNYQRACDEALRSPEQFWGRAAEAIPWHRRWKTVLDRSNAPLYRWFSGGELNTCYSALDYHVEHGRAGQPALIYDSPVTGTRHTFTYSELLDQVARFAGVLASLGVGKGDRVVIYMPMTPEALIAMYACARIGAIHSVVFGGFASHELAVRIEDAAPKVVVSASCGIEIRRVVEYKPLLDRALEISRHKPEYCVTLQRPTHRCALVPPRDLDWHELMASARPADWVPVAATDPLYILYTSGTMGAMPSRSSGRWSTCTGCSRGTCSGRRRTSVGP
jgi:propionyl-CoA synthetase